VAASSTPLFSEGGAGTLRLMLYLFAAVFLMVADYRGGHLQQMRAWLSLLNEPLYQAAVLPATGVRALRDGLATQRRLSHERDELERELLIARAQLARFAAVQNENLRLRELLGGTRGLGMNVRLASLSDFDLDPFRHRVVLDLGGRDGVKTGMALIDAGGVFGQVIAVTPLHSTAMLITDPAHAIPVQVQRSGLRMIAYGTGEIDRLTIPNIPQSADIEEGDLLLTSGLGGRFPAGLPVGKVTRLQADNTRLFVVADAVPVAALSRSGQVLMVWNEPLGPEVLEMGPPRSLAPPPVSNQP